MNSLSFKTIAMAFQKIDNPFLYILDKCGLIKEEFVISTRNGLCFVLRPKKRTPVADIDILDEVLLLGEYWKEGFTIDSTDTVVDIGAQIGIFSLAAAKYASSGKVFAYEPIEDNFGQLKKNKDINGLDNLKIFREAVGAKKGKLNIFVTPNNVGAHSFVKNIFSSGYQVVNSTTLADIFRKNKIEKIDFLKIDCEGAEYDILLKSPSAYLKRVRKISMEQHYTDYLSRKYEADVIKRRLESLGFSVRIRNYKHYKDEGVFWMLFARNEALESGKPLNVKRD